MPLIDNQKDLICNALLHSRDGIIIADPEGVILLWSQGAQKILGISEDDAIHQSLSSLPMEPMDEGGDFFALMENAMAEKNSMEVISIQKCPDGAIVTLSINATPAPFEDGAGKSFGCVFVFKDISVIKKRETELEKKINFLEGYLAKFNEAQMANMKLMKELMAKRKEVEELNAKLHSMNYNIYNALGDVSHEILSPLSNIIGYSNLLTNEKGCESERIQEYLNLILRSGFKIQRLAQRILDVSKLESAIESGTFTLNIFPFDFNELVREILDDFQIPLSEKKIQTEALLEKTPLQIQADREMISQVVSNLMSNAIKYTNSKGRITVASSEEGNFVRLRVSDTGIGIPKEDLPKIFDRFHRVSHCKVKTPTGIGIGLNLVKSIIELHNGQITVDSRLGEGSDFNFLLPKDQPERSVS
jgi:PAS domain S-box-containing protein